MRGLIVASVVGATLLTVGVASAEGSGSGLSLGLRTGYALPLGDAAKDVKMSDAGIKGQIPIWLDAGYKINPSMYVGAFFSYGIGMIDKDKACRGASCSLSDMRFGANFHYHIMPEASFDPWVGIGIGYEMLKISADSADISYKGFEFADIQLGGDYKVTPAFGIGPWLAFSLGQYSSGTVTAPNGQSLSGDITDKGMHEWLMFGVRGVYDISM